MKYLPLLLMLGVAVVVRLGVAFPANPKVGGLQFDDGASAGESLWERLARIFHFTEFGILALGLSPIYLARKLFRAIVPGKVEELEREGAVGAERQAELERFLSLLLALILSFAINFALLNGPTFDQVGTLWFVQLILNQVAGFALLLYGASWIGTRGFGGGEAMIWFVWTAGAVVRAITDIGLTEGTRGLVVATSMTLLLIPFAVVAACAEHRVPIQTARRVVGRQMMGEPHTYIPLAVSPHLRQAAGAWSVMVGISAIVSLFGIVDPLTRLADGGWLSVWGLIVGATWVTLGLVVALFVNPAVDVVEVADDLHRRGGFIPGVRPGPQTETYLERAQARLAVGAVMTLFLILYIIPMVITDALVGASAGFDLLVTSLLPATIIVIDQWREWKEKLDLHNIDGFLR